MFSYDLTQFTIYYKYFKFKKQSIMKKKEYERPSVEVVVLQHSGMLMTSGDVGATMNGEFTEQDAAREIDFEDLSTLMGK